MKNLDVILETIRLLEENKGLHKDSLDKISETQAIRMKMAHGIT